MSAILGELVRARVSHALRLGEVLLKDFVRVELCRVHACLAAERGVERAVIDGKHFDQRRLASL